MFSFSFFTSNNVANPNILPFLTYLSKMTILIFIPRNILDKKLVEDIINSLVILKKQVI